MEFGQVKAQLNLRMNAPQKGAINSASTAEMVLYDVEWKRIKLNGSEWLRMEVVPLEKSRCLWPLRHGGGTDSVGSVRLGSVQFGSVHRSLPLLLLLLLLLQRILLRILCRKFFSELLLPGRVRSREGERGERSRGGKGEREREQLHRVSAAGGSACALVRDQFSDMIIIFRHDQQRKRQRQHHIYDYVLY